MAPTIWTEHNVAASEITHTDHYPLWECVGDQWDYTGLPAGSAKAKVIDMVKPIRVRLDKTVTFLRYYFTASNATLYFRLFMNGRLIGQDSKAVTTEEATHCEITMPRLISSGEGTIHLLAKGLYQVKGDTMKVVAFYRAGWNEHEPPDTPWTEHTVS